MKLRHLYRPDMHSMTTLPLKVRSTGSFQITAGENYERVPGWFTQLFWCCKGQIVALLGDKKITIRTDDVFILFPGELHFFKSVAVACSFRWLTLDGPDTQMILDSFGLKRIHSAGPCPTEVFSDLEIAVTDATAMGERRASLAAYNLLLMATASATMTALPERQERSISAAKEIIDHGFTDSRLNIADISQKVSLHRSNLYRLFLQRFGISPIQYLMRLRITRALTLLKETTLPIAEIAGRSGFSDAAYFSKQIKTATGFNPRDFRKL